MRAGELRSNRQQLETSGVVTPRYPKERKPISNKLNSAYLLAMIASLLLWAVNPIASSVSVALVSTVMLTIVDWNRVSISNIIVIVLILMVALRFIFLTVV